MDRLWSEAVRKRDPACQYPNCGKPSENSHHLFSRRNRATRWDLENGVGLCVYHHIWGKDSAHMDPIRFHRMIEQRMGKSLYESLYQRAHSICKDQDLEGIMATLEAQ